MRKISTTTYVVYTKVIVVSLLLGCGDKGNSPSNQEKLRIKQKNHMPKRTAQEAEEAAQRWVEELSKDPQKANTWKEEVLALVTHYNYGKPIALEKVDVPENEIKNQLCESYELAASTASEITQMSKDETNLSLILGKMGIILKKVGNPGWGFSLDWYLGNYGKRIEDILKEQHNCQLQKVLNDGDIPVRTRLNVAFYKAIKLIQERSDQANDEAFKQTVSNLLQSAQQEWQQVLMSRNGNHDPDGEDVLNPTLKLSLSTKEDKQQFADCMVRVAVYLVEATRVYYEGAS